LNDAWSDNWGFVPLTGAEIAYAGRKLKSIVFDDLIRVVAEFEGEPVAFMITLPNLNEVLKSLNGSLFPFGWAKLLWWLRAHKVKTARVPLMGVVKSPGISARQPDRLPDDRVHPPRCDRQLWHVAR
jgi:hypothetical protein